MCKSVIYKILPIGLALLIAFASSGLFIDAHICQGQLRSVNIFGKAKTCAEIVNHCQAKKVEKSNSLCCSQNKKGCCDNKQILLKSDHELFQPEQLSFITFPDFLGPQLQPVVQQADIYSVRDLLFEKYKPPLIRKDIPILTQSFLL